MFTKFTLPHNPSIFTLLLPYPGLPTLNHAAILHITQNLKEANEEVMADEASEASDE